MHSYRHTAQNISARDGYRQPRWGATKWVELTAGPAASQYGKRMQQPSTTAELRAGSITDVAWDDHTFGTQVSKFSAYLVIRKVQLPDGLS